METGLCDRRPSENLTNNKNTELWNPISVSTSIQLLLHPRLRKHLERRTRKIETEDEGVCLLEMAEIIPVSSKHELNKDNATYVQVDRR